jgi:hypothetical protein
VSVMQNDPPQTCHTILGMNGFSVVKRRIKLLYSEVR